jgi:AmpD protein
MPSPNCDERPSGCVVDLIVIHGISLPPGQFGSGCIHALFLNTLNWNSHEYFIKIKDLKVSSHVLLERDGSLVQFVPLQRRAWHAGESCFRGRTRCNDYSIGIELEGTDDRAYTPAQYRALASVIARLRACYPGIGSDRIVGHCHIAPGRKTDPGASFRWDELGRLLGERPGWGPGAADA